MLWPCNIYRAATSRTSYPGAQNYSTADTTVPVPNFIKSAHATLEIHMIKGVGIQNFYLVHTLTATTIVSL